VRPFLKSQKGFIFIDALVGMVILSVALLALAAAYRQATITTVAAREYNNAVYVAQQAAEELKRNDGRTTGNADWTIANGTETINNVPYTVNVPPPLIENLVAKANITVSWPENNTGISITSYYYLSP